MSIIKDFSIGRFMWWKPTNVTNPWKPRFFKGCDEWHNKSYAVIIPFLGCYTWFFGPFSRVGEVHIYAYNGSEGWSGKYDPNCDICKEIMDDI